MMMPPRVNTYASQGGRGGEWGAKTKPPIDVSEVPIWRGVQDTNKTVTTERGALRGGQMGDTNPLFSVFDKNAFLSESDPKM